MDMSKQVFSLLFAVFFGAILRVAQDWLPFTPGRISRGEPFQAVPRMAMSLLFLVVLPALYFTWVIVALSETPSPVAMPHRMVSFDALKFLIMILLVFPVLGFYDLWQGFMRWKPAFFYTESAQARVRQRMPDAFIEAQSAFISALCCFLPVVAFLIVR